jgi:hypothetical protein
MNNAKYFIWVDTSVDEAACTERGGPRTWIDDLGHCATIATGTDHLCQSNGMISTCDGAVYELDQDKWDKLTDDAEGAMYALDPVPAYLNAYNCQKDHPEGDGEIDLANQPYDGSLPACFFKIPITKGAWNPSSGEFELVDL